MQQQATEIYDIRQVVDNVDNNIRKNNLSIKGLKEGAEGYDLWAYVEELFTDCLGSDSNVTDYFLERGLAFWEIEGINARTYWSDMLIGLLK